MNEASGADGCGVNYEGQSAYDVADMLKQYFRDLPEPLFTSKLSETFLQIYQCKCNTKITLLGEYMYLVPFFLKKNPNTFFELKPSHTCARCL